MTAPEDPVLQAARRYTREGDFVTPLRGKPPILKEWQKKRLSDELLPVYFKDRCGVGVLNGVEPGNLADADFDSPESKALASKFMPKTGRVFGRESCPHSHSIYRTDYPVQTRRFEDPKTGDVLHEVRGTGTQTLYPPSPYPDGERCVYLSDEEPTPCQTKRVMVSAQRLAAAALLLRYWPRSSRHKASLALGGGLARSGWQFDKIVAFMEPILEAAEDEEIPDRIRAIKDSVERLLSDDPTTGWPRLAEVMDQRVVAKVKEWLAIEGDAPSELSSDKPSQAKLLVQIFQAQYEIGLSTEGEPFAVLKREVQE